MAEATVSITTESKNDDPPVIKDDSIDPVPKAVINELSAGVLNLYQTDIEKMHARVKEIICNQGVLLDSTQNEVVQLRECIMLHEISETFNEIKTYQKKLQNMKKNMNNLSEKTIKIKTRAQKLCIQKQKEELHIAQEKEKQRKYEHELTAKPVSSKTGES